MKFHFIITAYTCMQKEERADVDEEEEEVDNKRQ